MAALKDALPSDDTAKIKGAIEELQREVMSLGQAVYGGAGGAGAPGGGAEGADGAPGKKAGGDDVIDADFEDSK